MEMSILLLSWTLNMQEAYITKKTGWKWREKYVGLMKWKWMRDLIGPQITSVRFRWSSQLDPVISLARSCFWWSCLNELIYFFHLNALVATTTGRHVLGGEGSQSIWLQTTLIVYIDELRHSKRWELLCAHWGKSVWYSVWLSAENPSVSYHLLWASDREIEVMRWLSDCFLAQEARESKIIPDMVLNGNATKRWIHLMLKYIYLL